MALHTLVRLSSLGLRCCGKDIDIVHSGPNVVSVRWKSLRVRRHQERPDVQVFEALSRGRSLQGAELPTRKGLAECVMTKNRRCLADHRDAQYRARADTLKSTSIRGPVRARAPRFDQWPVAGERLAGHDPTNVVIFDFRSDGSAGAGPDPRKARLDVTQLNTEAGKRADS